ncbi:transposable element Tcb2 transposase [Trichonephila clavipes]|nr:transposable element Tcb2 transposase [Trichonephila clavipes]
MSHKSSHSLDRGILRSTDSMRSAHVRIRVFQADRDNHRDDGSWVVSSVSGSQVGRSALTVRRCWDQWTEDTSFTRRPGRPRQTSRREDRHIIRQARVERTASLATVQTQAAPSIQAPVSSRTIARRLAEGHLVVFSDESGFNLSSDDNRIRVWRPRGECLNPALALQRNTAPTAGVMVWGVIVNDTRSPLILIHGTMTAQRYVHDILQPNVLPLMAGLPRAIFQQVNGRPHTAKMSQDCLRHITPLPWPARFPDLSTIDDIWDHLGRQFDLRSHYKATRGLLVTDLVILSLAQVTKTTPELLPPPSPNQHTATTGGLGAQHIYSALALLRDRSTMAPGLEPTTR